MNAIISPQPRAPGNEDLDLLFEIIDGQRVELAPMSYLATLIATSLVSELHQWAKTHNVGRAAGETLFQLGASANRSRRPDLAFVSYERWPKDRPLDAERNAWDVVPDLAVEVISPHDYAEELLDKIDEYFRAGVRVVWVVYPKHALVHVYESLTAVRVLSRDDTLDGGAVLSGFRLPLRELFVEA
jgi:Uma2 family endonuclease